jgi:hypothetical protein
MRIINIVSTRGTAKSKEIAQTVYSRSAQLNLENKRIIESSSSKEDPYYNLVRS